MLWIPITRLWIGAYFFSCLFNSSAIAYPLPAPASESSGSLENLPAGQYYYRVTSRDPEPEQPQGYVLLRKAGHSVIGIDRRSLNQASCFRGFLAGSRIVNATRIFPPYQPDSKWDRRGELLDLSRYQSIEHHVTDEEADALHRCLAFFSR